MEKEDLKDSAPPSGGVKDDQDGGTQHDLAQHDGPFQSAFWSPTLAKQRAAYFKVVILGTLLITVIVILGVFSIYWGALWDTQNGVHNINCAVVDFDGGIIGSSVSQSIVAFSGPKTQLDYYTVPASEFGSVEAVADAVVGERYWLAIVINSGATNALNAAIASADASYNESQAVTIYTNVGRAENAYTNYIYPSVQEVMKQATTTFGLANAKSLASNANLAALLRTAPQVVTTPVAYTIYGLRPFDVPVGASLTFVGLIYLLIVAFVAAMQQFGARTESGLDRQLKLRSLIGLRLATIFLQYFWLSWMYSFVSLAFQVPFSRYYGPSGFVIYWAMSFVAIGACGLALEAMITLLTPKFIALFLIFWIIVNDSVCFFPIQILPTIFRYGYATPFYNVSRTVRAVLFNTRNQIGLNFGVQFAWVVISLITLPLLQTFARRRQVRQYEQARAASQNGAKSDA